MTLCCLMLFHGVLWCSVRELCVSLFAEFANIVQRIPQPSVFSAASMDSEWVKTEIAKARKREMHENRRVLFPVRLVDFETLRDWECFDADTGKDSAREVREYFIPDFSNWKADHDAYTQAFDHLLRDLKTQKQAAGGS